MKKIHFAFLSIFILLILTCLIQFFKFESETESRINESLADSIQKDLYIRVNSLKVNKRKIESNNSINSTQKGIRITTEKQDSIIVYDGNHISKEEIYFNQSLMDQSATRVLNPINLENLHSIFQNTLTKNNILTNSSIHYIDKVSNETDSFPKNNTNSIITYYTPKIELGLEKEMIVVASVSYSVTNLFRHQTDIFIISFFLLIFFILIYPSVYLIYKIRTNKIAQRHIKEKNIYETTKHIIKKESDDYLFGEFLLDTKSKILKWDTNSIDLSRRREFLLLIALLESPNNSLTKDQAAEILEIHNYKYNNQLNSSITRLRAILKPDPTIIIESKRGEGYHLIISCDSIMSVN